MCNTNNQKQSSTGVVKKRCPKNMQQIYRRTLMPKSDFNKIVKQLRFAVYFQIKFSYEHLWMAAHE